MCVLAAGEMASLDKFVSFFEGQKLNKGTQVSAARAAPYLHQCQHFNLPGLVLHALAHWTRVRSHMWASGVCLCVVCVCVCVQQRLVGVACRVKRKSGEHQQTRPLSSRYGLAFKGA